MARLRSGSNSARPKRRAAPPPSSVVLTTKTKRKGNQGLCASVYRSLCLSSELQIKKGPRTKRSSKHSTKKTGQSTEAVDKPPHYVHINRNEYIHNGHKQQKDDDIAICACKYVADDPESACGDHCLNVLTFTECTSSHCPCGAFCKNQRFQRQEYIKLKLVKTEERGWGMLADQDVKAGEFIIEYCGEVISNNEARLRSHAYELEGLKDAYIFSLSGSESIDATKKGSLARFINHSCDPNCETRKWTVLGEVRVGIFSKKDIQAGTELTYNYNFEWYGGAKVRCQCGASSCVGFLGAKSKGFQNDTYVWEDNDERFSVENVPLYDSEDEPLSNFLKRAQKYSKLKKTSLKTTASQSFTGPASSETVSGLPLSQDKTVHEEKTLLCEIKLEPADEVTQKTNDITHKPDDDRCKVDDAMHNADDVTQMADDVTPKVDDVTPKVDDVMHNADDVTQTADDITQKVDDVTLEVDDVMHKANDVIPRVDDVLHKANDAMHKADDAMHTVDDLTCKVDDDVLASTKDSLQFVGKIDAVAQPLAQIQELNNASRVEGRSEAGRKRLFKGNYTLPPERSRFLAAQQIRMNINQPLNLKSISRCLVSKEAHEEFIAAKEIEENASMELKEVYKELKPAVEEHGKDGQDSLPIASAEKWIAASCTHWKALFDMHYVIVKNTCAVYPLVASNSPEEPLETANTNPPLEESL